MDNKYQRRNHTQGHENHGVHVCHKCGWPFPNAHPSAKHRRAHKKICGTIEGYKCLQTPSDDEHHSDDDHKTQGLKALETENNEKGVGGIGERSFRSGDEVFLDAVADFSDGVPSPGVKETLRDSLDSASDREMIHGKHLEFSGSFEDNGSNEENQSIFKSRNDIHMQNPKIFQSERVDDGNVPELQGWLSSSTVNPLESATADLKTENLTVVHTNDCFGLTSESKLTKSEAMSDVMLENKICADKNVRVCSLTFVAKEATLKEIEEIKSDTDMVDIVVSSNNTVGGTFEGVSEIAVSDVVNSNYQVADGAFNLEKNNALFPSVMRQDDLPLEVDSDESINAFINGIQVESAHMIELATPGHVKMFKEREEGNVNVLTPPSCDDSVYADNEGVISQNSSSLHSSKALKQDQHNLNDSVTEEQDFFINQGQMSEKREVLSQDLHAFYSDMKEKQVNCELMAEEMHAEKSIEVCPVTCKVESNRRLDGTGASMTAMKIDMTASPVVHFSEEQGSDDVCKNSQKVNLPKGTFMVASNENPIDASFGSAASETTTVISRDNIICHEKNITSIECANRGPLSCAQEGIKDDEIINNDRSNENCSRIASTTDDSHQAHAGELLLEATEGFGWDHSSASSLNIEPSAQHVSAVQDAQDGEPGKEFPAVVAVPVQDQSGNNDVKLSSSAIYTSVEPGSRCDSLEANEGSVSVLSVQSDAQAAIEAEALSSTDLPASAEADESKFKDPEAASERLQCEKTEMFEPPSFMTLVEPGHIDGSKPAASEVHTEPNKQQSDSFSSQAGWFPTLTHVTNESEGRKRNEEIIAKVTNRITSKQKAPLKSLLGKAAHSSNPKSPKSEKCSVDQKNGKVAEDNGSGLTTVNSILGRESPTAQAVKGENAKEWNSPARYPADVKREKKKTNSKSYWIHFLCCSSVDTR